MAKNAKPSQFKSPVTKPETKKESTVTLVATQNTQMPDGTFIAKGKEVKVSKAYADKVTSEVNPHLVYK